MNKAQKNRRAAIKLLDRKYHFKEGAIKVNASNTIEHELAKFFLCWEAKLLGKEFITEAIFENGKRADILILDDLEAWEVLKSESMEEVLMKTSQYPVPVRPFKAEVVNNIWLSKIMPVPDIEEDDTPAGVQTISEDAEEIYIDSISDTQDTIEVEHP